MQFLRGGNKEKCVGYPAKKALQTTQMKYCNGVFDARFELFLWRCVFHSANYRMRARERERKREREREIEK